MSRVLVAALGLLAGCFNFVSSAPDEDRVISSGATGSDGGGNTPGAGALPANVARADGSQILSGYALWNSDGSVVQGSLATHGALDLDTQALPGGGGAAAGGYYSGLSLSLNASQVCQGSKLLGQDGGAVCNSVFGDLMSSQGLRADTVTNVQTSPVSNTRKVATLRDESNYATNYGSLYRDYVRPEFDSDLFTDPWATSFARAGWKRRFHLETAQGRPRTTCGTTGTLSDRIASCGSLNSGRAKYWGRASGQHGEGDWELVMTYQPSTFPALSKPCPATPSTGVLPSDYCYEIWRDVRTGLVWSDASRHMGYLSDESDTSDDVSLQSYYTWFEAAGWWCLGAGCKADTTGYALVGFDLTTTANKLYQTTPPLSGCTDASILNADPGGYGVTNFANLDEPSRAELNATNGALKVHWRLPTQEDYQLANVNGARLVLPNMGQTFWTSSSSTVGNVTKNAIYYSGKDGTTAVLSRSSGMAVRCVGEVIP